MMCTSQHLIPYNLNNSIVIQLLDIAHKLRTLSLHALYLEANINNAAIKLFAKKESRRNSTPINLDRSTAKLCLYGHLGAIDSRAYKGWAVKRARPSKKV